MRPGTLWLSAASLLALSSLGAFSSSEHWADRTEAALASCVEDCSFGTPFDHAAQAFKGRLIGLALILGAAVFGVVGLAVRLDPLWHRAGLPADGPPGAASKRRPAPAAAARAPQVLAGHGRRPRRDAVPGRPTAGRYMT